MNQDAKLVTEIAQAIRADDLSLYQNIRYPAIQDGEEIVFVNEDFSEVDFSQFNLGFMTFNKCNLQNSSGFSGFGFKIVSCSAQGIDLRDTSVVFEAQNSDFRDIIYNENTVLAEQSPNVPSEFIDCKVDNTTKMHFDAQGVIFR